MKILVVLVAAAVIFAFFRVSAILLRKYSHKNAVLGWIKRAAPVIQVVVWTVFVFWAVGNLLKDRVYYPHIVTAMALIVMALITWFFFRDVVAGVVFRVQNDLNVGDNIQIGSISGQVKSVRLTHIEINTDQGSTIKIPNTRLFHEVISGSTTPEGLEEYKIQLTVNKARSKVEIEEKIVQEVTNSPWCDFKSKPVIRLRDENDTDYFYDVVIYTMNPRHLSIAEKALKNKLDEW